MDIDWQELENYVRESAVGIGVGVMSLAISIEGRRRLISVQGDERFTLPMSATEFEIGCVSRTLIATLALTLHNLKMLDIDRPIRKLMRELEEDQRYDRVTLRHLLSHTAGYEGIGYADEADVTVDQLMPELRYATQVFSPGSVFNYEGSNSLLACAIISRELRRPIVELLRKYISNIGATSKELFAPVRTPMPQIAANGSTELRDDTSLAGPMIMRVELKTLLSVGEAICGGESEQTDGIWLGALYRDTTRIPRAPMRFLNGSVPVTYGVGTVGYANGLFGHDGRTDEHSLSFRFSPKQQMVIALGVATSLVPARNSLFEGVLQRLGIACAPITRREEIFEMGELTGVYVGSSTTLIEVTAESKVVTVHIVKEGYGDGVRVRGKVDAIGNLEFASEGTPWNPTFFRDPDTDCPSLMIGMKAFRRGSPVLSREIGKVRVSAYDWAR